MNKNLTLNMGVRWEPFITAIDQNGFNAAFVRDAVRPGPAEHDVSERAGRPGVPGRRGLRLPGGGQEPQEPVEPVGAALRPGVGSAGRHQADGPRRRRPLLRRAEALDVRASRAELAVRPDGQRDCSPPVAPAATIGRNGCPLPFADPWRYTPGGDPLTGRLARQGEPLLPIPSNVRVPAQRALRERAAGHRRTCR